jgi:hypothetical protein
MNQIAPIIAERRAQLMTAERRAFLRLALQQRRLSWAYLRFALEDEKAGKLDSYRKNKQEAQRLRRDAHWHLDRAKETHDGA